MEIPDIPDDEIVPSRPDLGWFWKMAVALALIVASFYGLSHALAAVVVSNLSLSDERRYFSGFDDAISEGAKPFPLEAMAYRPSLPEGVSLFITDRSEANAYATLGGSVFVTRGLLENVENEETLTFVIGHEIGHIVARDPIRRLASDMPFSISLAFVASSLWMDFAGLPELTTNYFSRKQETSADRAGLETLKILGADARCAAGFFNREDSVFDAYLEFSSTHPQTARRKEEILAFARMQSGAENFEQTPRCRPLPDELRNAFLSLEKP